VSRKKKPLRLNGKFTTPAKLAIWKRELAERKLDKKAKPKKAGRPASARTIQRRKLKAKRQIQVFEQRVERTKRARDASGKLRASYRSNARLSNGSYDLKTTRDGGYEKRVYRFRGMGSMGEAVDVLTEQLGRGWKVTAQMGAGYQRGRDWVGSRITSPAQASVWLQGIGLQYRARGALGNDPSQVWIEVIAIKKTRKGKK